MQPAGELAYSLGMDRWRIYAELTSAGLVFVAAILLGALLGRWLDGLTGAGGIFTALLMAAGLAGAVANLLRALRRIG